MTTSDISDSAILEWLTENFFLLDAVALSFMVAGVRIFHGGGARRIALLEAIFCGLITAGAFPVIQYFNLPHSMAAAMGALIGTLGIKKIVAVAHYIADLKLPPRKRP